VQFVDNVLQFRQVAAQLEQSTVVPVLKYRSWQGQNEDNADKARNFVASQVEQLDKLVQVKQEYWQA